MLNASKCRRARRVLMMGTVVAAAVLSSALCAQAGSVAVTVSGITPNGTQVLVALCTEGLAPSNCGRGEQLVAQSGTMRTVFSNVQPGRYAVAAYQDMNGNGSIERTRLGLPLEPYGFSNGAGQARRPNFEAAAFNVREGTVSVSVALRRISQREKE